MLRTINAHYCDEMRNNAQLPLMAHPQRRKEPHR